jgi:hypothetical protein
MRIVIRIVTVILLCMILGSCRSTARESEATSFSDKGTSKDARTREAAMADCIQAIHARLLSLRGDYPQLSDIGQATVTATGLRYNKGHAVAPKKQQWSRPDGCLIIVEFMKYSPTNDNQTGAIRKFPEYGIQVYWLIQPIRLDSFYKTVASVIREEIERLRGANILPEPGKVLQPADQR